MWPVRRITVQKEMNEKLLFFILSLYSKQSVFEVLLSKFSKSEFCEKFGN